MTLSAPEESPGVVERVGEAGAFVIVVEVDEVVAIWLKNIAGTFR